MDQPALILPRVLADLDKASLIDLIIRQGGQLHELWQENEALKQRIEELERAGQHAVAPFRIREEKRKQDKKQAGAPRGHVGHYRQVSGPLDERVEVPLPACPHCGGGLTQLKPVRQVIEELLIRPYRLALTTYEGQCASCGRVSSTHPWQVSHGQGSSGCQLGIQATTLAVALNHQFGMSKQGVCRLFTEQFGLPLTIGGLVALQHRIAQGLQADYEALRHQARQSAVLHSDETSWYVGSPHSWLWTFTTPDFTLYQVASSRKREVIESVIGSAYEGVLVSDCLAVYDGVCSQQQKCLAHHLKAIRLALEQAPNSEYLLDWQRLLQAAIQLKKQQGCLPQPVYWDQVIALVLEATTLLNKPRAAPCEEKIWLRLAKQADHLFVFLRLEQVEATNNRAERSLRPAVIHRKVSCGNKTPKGANTWQILASLTTTARQNHIDFTQKVRAVIKQRL
jgi:transposase